MCVLSRTSKLFPSSYLASIPPKLVLQIIPEKTMTTTATCSTASATTANIATTTDAALTDQVLLADASYYTDDGLTSPPSDFGFRLN